MKHLHLAVIALLLALTIMLGIMLTIKPKTSTHVEATWASELARTVDPKYAGDRAGFVTFYMSCGTDVPGVTGTQYLAAEFDINLKTGAMRPLKVDLPSAGFMCPKDGIAAPRPAPMQPGGVPPQTPSATPTPNTPAMNPTPVPVPKKP